ncbi:hypothetical protein HY632_03020 [Candidatus Uhrbacteria bacterium]|nr:hypothetical protein [Candidatus Uhrbacteria bacterium]
MSDWTIVEHRRSGEWEHVVGIVEGAEVHGDSAFCVTWRHHGGGHRDTQFSPNSWRCSVVAGVVFLVRTASDGDGFDLPWRDANLYTLFRQMR